MNRDNEKSSAVRPSSGGSEVGTLCGSSGDGAVRRALPIGHLLRVGRVVGARVGHGRGCEAVEH
eukprot:2815570-Rhodomonas_salina.1